MEKKKKNVSPTGSSRANHVRVCGETFQVRDEQKNEHNIKYRGHRNYPMPV